MGGYLSDLCGANGDRIFKHDYSRITLPGHIPFVRRSVTVNENEREQLIATLS